ncbi:spore germination protein [Paramaledivibacter caminithermalis]|uniref:Stage V sporulation protein AF n=1 Tax=Paramaledivibacter caminithermalis (strain DSM 15212 / CIP 107654 / DViRD3) TaxID=1121301 RepID=A0A1M6Q292_PARC5|nr:spore germination protein [Paramaledivibacter caminithermalis]SHK14339.1 stage V sporulation protein AF [Paramaledivibacter caminithermalis DSM 15212]
MKLSKKISENIGLLDNRIGISKSFDIVNREIKIGGRAASLLFIDGFAKDDIMLFIQKTLQCLRREDINSNIIEKLMTEKIAYLEVEVTDEIEQLEFMVLSGALAILIDKEDKAIILDVRTYPARGPEEPELEKVTRGSRDGFTETLVFNTALIRRRIRDPNLRFEITKVGTRSKTDVVIGYIKDIANPKLINDLKKKIDEIRTDALEMSEKTLEEFILGRNWNPLPQARYTERPDVTASHLLEGHIILIVDNSPSVMIVPVTMFHFTQHAQDYYQNPAVGTYFRWIRFIGIFFSLIIPPLWLLLVYYKGVVPDWLEFLGPKKTGEIPLLIQFIILEFGIDLLRIASIHTPNVLSTSLAIIGGLVLSEFAIKVGWFVPETVLYMAVAGLGMFATPSIEFSMAIRLFRLILLIATGLFKIYGFVIALIFIFIVFITTKSFGYIRYTWPLIPFNGKTLATILTRKPIPEVRERPSFLNPKNKEAAPPNEETPK